MRKLTTAALTLALYVAGTVLALAQAPVIDGYVRDPVTGVVEAPYVIKGITYTQDQATGDFAGYLFTAEDADNYYFAFSQSVHINDNTYGVNSIDWDRKQRHRLRDLTNSEHAEIRLYDSSGTLALDFFLDYATQDKKTGIMECLGATGGDGTMITGSAAHVTGASSSLVWNWNDANPLYPDRDTESPQRVPTNTYAADTTADPNAPWIYELVYEWSVAKAAFASGAFGSIEILEVHNSPLKTLTNPVPVPVLNVCKTANPPSGSEVKFGDTIIYEVKASNVGFTTISDVVISDAIDDNLYFVVPLDGGVLDETTRTITWPAVNLGPGESVIVRFQADATPVSADDLDIHNQAVIASPDLPAPAETNVTEHIVLPQPDLTVVKSGPAQAAYGQQFDYTITVANLGVTTASDVILVDTLPPEVTYVSANPAPVSVIGDKLSFSLGDMAYLQEATVTITVETAVSEGVAVNTATVSTPDEESDLTNNTATCTTTIQAADIALSLDCPVDMVAGENASYVITIANNGNTVASNVSVVDVLPAGVDFVDATPVPTDITGQTLTFSVGDLAPGASTTITINVLISATAGDATNTASASTDSQEGGQGAANNSAECTSTITAPDVAVAKSGPAQVVAGEGATYTVVVSNIGSALAKNVVLTDVLPAGLAYVSANPVPAAVDGQTLTFNLGDLAAGASTTITVDVTVEVTSGTLTNTATAVTDSVEGGEGTANNSDTATSTVIAPDVLVEKTGPTEVTAGQSAAYTVTVSNVGDALAKNVVLVDTLPDGLVFASADPAPVSVDGQVVTFGLGGLAVGGSTTLTINTTVTATAGSVTNVATATTDSVEGGEGTANNTASFTSVVKSADIAVALDCPVDMVAGESAAYVITVTNLGDATAANVSVVDILPDGVAFVDATPVPTDISGQAVSFSLGDIAAGGSSSITINVLVTATAGSATNVASASTDSVEGGQGAANNSADCASAILAPDVAVAKSGPAQVVAGEGASYTVTVQNIGTALAKNVVLTDVLPAGLAYVSATPAPVAVDGQTLTFNLGDLAVDASVAITINATVTVTAGTLTNTATAVTDSVEGGQGTANNTDTADSDVIAPDILVEKSGPASVVAGEASAHTVVVSNIGTAPAKNVVLVDTLPAGLALVSATPAPASVDGQVVTFNLGDIEVGASVTVTLNLTVTATAGTVTNVAAATTDSVEGGEGTANNSDTHTADILAADVVVTKVSDPATVVTNSTCSFQISFGNIGTATAKNVVVTDEVPEGLYEGDAFTATASVGTVSVSGRTVTVTVGYLAVSASGTLTITGTVTKSAAAVGNYTNTVVITTTSTQDDTTNDNDSADVEVVAPSLSLTKQSVVTQVTRSVVNTASVSAAEIVETASDSATDTVTAASRIAYTLTVSNNGNAAATNVVITDTLPADVNVVSNPDGGTVDGGTVTWTIANVPAGGNATINITVETLNQ